MMIDHALNDRAIRPERILPDTEFFDVSDIWKEMPEDGWEEPIDALLRTTPALAPFSRTWWEWYGVSDVWKREMMRRVGYVPGVWSGVNCVMMPFVQAARITREWGDRTRLRSDRFVSLLDVIADMERLGVATVAVCEVTACLSRNDRRVYEDIGQVFIGFDADGMVARDANGPLLACQPMGMQGEDNEEVQKGVNALRDTAWVMLYCIALLHVRNVIRVPHAADAKLQRARERRGKLPLVTYHTLRVVTPGEAKRYTDARERGENPEPPPPMRAHMVRGTFAHYPDEDGRRLFGKYHGVYWRPPHARGNKEAGVVVKDYQLKGRAQSEHERG